MIYNYKNEKGITLIALITTIIITLIIASVATVTGISTVKQTKYASAVSELKTMQYEVNAMYQKYKNGDEEVLNYGEEITPSTQNDKNESVQTLSNQAFNKLSIDGQERNSYRYFSKDYLENDLDISGITDDFLINIKKRNVILLKGIKYEDETYYALSQLENVGYNVEFEDENEEQSEQERDNIDTNNKEIEEKTDVCMPKVSGKEMIPVVWNQGTLSWVKADVTWNDEKNVWEQSESDLKWYDYSKNSKKWANIVTVEEKGFYTRQYYEQAQAGTEILMKDITSMYVWIPRYEYKNTYYTDDTYKEISAEETIYVESDVKFIGKDQETDDGYKVNSAFSYMDGSNNTINIEGFWIAKFEASNYNSKTPTSNIGANYGGSSTEPIVENPENVTENYLTIKPNVTSWRFDSQSGTVDYINQIIQVSSSDISNDGNEEKDIYGLESSAEIGLLTTEMWEVVAILAQSEYGNRVDETNNKVYGNFYYQGDGTENICYYTTLTGIVTQRDENDYSEITDGDITHLVTSKKEENTGHIKINDKYSYYEYWTDIGKKGSTSSNEYGIFDMVGGAAEYTMDSMGDYYIRGGSFWNISESTKEAANIFYKVKFDEINDINRTYSFRTGLVIK